MRLIVIALLFCGCAWAADEATDEADYKAYQEAQEAAQKDAQDVTQRDAEVKQIEADIVSLKERYKAMTTEQALAKWREDIRKNPDAVQRFSNYQWMKRVDDAVKKLKERTKVATADAAITAEKADVQAKKAK